jgi:hypothetical protein
VRVEDARLGARLLLAREVRARRLALADLDRDEVRREVARDERLDVALRLVAQAPRERAAVDDLRGHAGRA